MNLKLSTLSRVFALALAICAQPATGQGFSAGIAPSKFELRAKPGAVIRDTVLIMNASDKSAGYSLRTADWFVTDTQGLEYIEDRLADGSCRPWVKLERRTLNIAPGNQKRYRFEIHVPEDATAGLCKFALLIEPADTAMASTGGDQPIRFPVVGRYAVIVYVAVGDAQARVEYTGLGRGEMRGDPLPTLRLRNTGTTYDRVFGRITATDANGERHVLIPSNFPVLPNRSEEILLIPEASDDRQANQVSMKFPLQLKGSFEIGGQRFTVDERFD